MLWSCVTFKDLLFDEKFSQKGGSRQEGDPAGFEYEKKFYVEKVFTLFTSINIPKECEEYLMKMWKKCDGSLVCIRSKKQHGKQLMGKGK